MRRSISTFYMRLGAAVLALGLLSATSSAQVYKTLFHFNSSSVGLYPNGGLVFDGAGNLYGTAQGGGSCSGSSNGCGVVFELSPSGGGWTETVLYAFSGPDGSTPEAGVVFDSKGNLYGTTNGGGAYNNGTVFELTPTESGWQEHVLYSFSGGSDGGTLPYGVVVDGAGNVYGTTFFGGASNQGVLFQLTGSGSSWTENVLVNLNNLAGTGPSPLAFDASGNLYGTATTGSNYGNHEKGTIYQLAPNGLGGWTHSVFFTFTDIYPGGTEPGYGVAFDSAGDIYGTTTGVVLQTVGGNLFKLTPPSRTETELFYLQYGLFGGVRNSFTGPVTVDSVGNVYGSVYNLDEGYVQTYDGYVFRRGPSGSATYTFASLLPPNRFYPLGGLAIDAHGNVYGATRPAGANAVGAVFEVIF